MQGSLIHSHAAPGVEVGTVSWTVKTGHWLMMEGFLFYVSNHRGKLIFIEFYGEENSKRFHVICFFTWGGDMSPFWLSMSVGEGWGTVLNGESWLVGWSGDRASLLSSSREELSPPAPFGESVARRKTLSLQIVRNKSTFSLSRSWTTVRTWCTV